jgi:hypothetical protein
MGATSLQGWYLFVFMVGFTLGPAGLFALGWPVAIVGFALMAAALVGFRSIRAPVIHGPANTTNARVTSAVEQHAAKSY